jgi:hypothetical protein
MTWPLIVMLSVAVLASLGTLVISFVLWRMLKPQNSVRARKSASEPLTDVINLQGQTLLRLPKTDERLQIYLDTPGFCLRHPDGKVEEGVQ